MPEIECFVQNPRSPTPLPEANLQIGIEYTLKEFCPEINIDPQHTGGKTNLSAIKALAEMKNVPGMGLQKVVLATVRADLDSVGTMALYLFRSELGGRPLSLEFIPNQMLRKLLERVDFIHRGDSQGLHMLSSDEEKATWMALSEIVSNWKTPIRDRVQFMHQWLLGKEEVNIAKALEEIKTLQTEAKTLRVDTVKTCYVESQSRGVLAAAYSQGYDLVLAYNPTMPSPNGQGTYKKWTIAKRDASVVFDLPGFFALLNEVEEAEGTWGGSPNIGGSPQGVDSSILPERMEALLLAKEGEELTPEQAKKLVGVKLTSVSEFACYQHWPLIDEEGIIVDIVDSETDHKFDEFNS